MIIKEVEVAHILDSRRNETIKVKINGCTASAPSGKSKGKHEAVPYKKTLREDIRKLKSNIHLLENIEIKSFDDLVVVEKEFRDKIGANSMVALECAILKALAKSQGRELYQIVSLGMEKGHKIKSPLCVGNAIGGGVHSEFIAGKRPDFQEFLFLGKQEDNKKAYELAGKELKKEDKHFKGTRNDEGAWETSLDNEAVLDIMRDLANKLGIGIGLDIAASSFFVREKYNYKNYPKELSKEEQIDYIERLIKRFYLIYVEDPLQEKDFPGFSALVKDEEILIIGDDLTTTKLKRVEKAIKLKSINSLIVKPNQIGSLIEVREVIKLCKKHKIIIIFSHRSGETMDDALADLAVGFGADFIKCGIYGKEREIKLKRLKEIEKKIGKKYN